MKYLIGNICINADHVIRVDFSPASADGCDDTDFCTIDMVGDVTPIQLYGPDAVSFWKAYTNDASWVTV